MALQEALLNKFDFFDTSDENIIMFSNIKNNVTVELTYHSRDDIFEIEEKEGELEDILCGAFWSFHYYALILDELEDFFIGATFDVWGLPFFVSEEGPRKIIEIASNFFNIFKSILYSNSKTRKCLKAFKRNLYRIRNLDNTYNLSKLVITSNT